MAPSAPRISIDGLITSSPTSPSTQRGEDPFPRPGSSRRPSTSTSTRLRSRRSSTASSIHSVGGSLDTTYDGHRGAETAQNAISILLQAPIVRTGLIAHTSAPPSSAHKPPTARDIPPVTLTTIRHVENGEFAPYLAQVGALYQALQRAKEPEEGDGPPSSRKTDTADHLAELVELERKHSSRRVMSRQDSLASVASVASSVDATTTPRRRSTRPKHAAQAPAALSTVPDVYFDEDFHLENPRTFDVVSERSEVVKPTPGTPDEKRALNGSAGAPRRALATNAILQEKLSWYMDTVEIHLVSAISTASTSFFTALGSLQDLQTEAAESVSRIQGLRRELDKVDQDVAMAGLTVAKKRRELDNVRRLSHAIQQAKSVVRHRDQCAPLIEAGQVDEALRMIKRTEEVIAGESEDTSIAGAAGLLDLRQVAAFRNVRSDLDMFRHRIGKLYETRLLNFFLADLRRHLEAISPSEVLQRWSNSSQRSRGHQRDLSSLPAYMITPPDFRSELHNILTGLQQARHIVPATAAYRDAFLKEIRNILKRYMPSSTDEDAESTMSSSTTGGASLARNQRSAILARNLRALDAADAETLLQNTYIGIGETMRRLGTQVKLLLDVTSVLGEGRTPTADPRSPPRSPHLAGPGIRASASPTSPKQGYSIQNEMHQILDIHNLLGQAVDVAQDKIVRVLKVRAEQSIAYPMEYFLRYFTLNSLFATECEAVSGRSGAALKTVVNGHIRDFARELGDRERQELANGMEGDPWNARDFNEQDSAQLERILQSSTQDVSIWKDGNKIWLPLKPSRAGATSNGMSSPMKNGVAPSAPDTGTSTPTARTACRPASIPPHTFLLPLSASLCLHGLAHLLELGTCIPSIIIDIASASISYLTLFNSRTTQLILGAGATRSSANLKNITTKHLALALQSLTFITTLIPHVREAVRRLAPSNVSISQVMGEFERCRRIVGEHEEQIRDKFGEIMRGRGLAHVKSLRALDWSSAGPPREGGVNANAYMETLCKETLTLHKVLTKHLPAEGVVEIMRPVFDGYKYMLVAAYEEVQVGTESGWLCMLQDAEYFRNKLGSLEGAGETVGRVVAVVKAKEPPRSVEAPVEVSAVPEPDAPTQEHPPSEASEPKPKAVVAEKGLTNGDAKDAVQDDTPTTVAKEQPALSSTNGEAAAIMPHASDAAPPPPPPPKDVNPSSSTAAES